jgi:hypothetical protein
MVGSHFLLFFLLAVAVWRTMACGGGFFFLLFAVRRRTTMFSFLPSANGEPFSTPSAPVAASLGLRHFFTLCARKKYTTNVFGVHPNKWRTSKAYLPSKMLPCDLCRAPGAKKHLAKLLTSEKTHGKAINVCFSVLCRAFYDAR